jgi:hypothetical protein
VALQGGGMKKMPVCPSCNSEDILLDSLCQFDVATQEWIHKSDVGQMYCGDCDTSCEESELKWIEVEEP